MMYGFEGDFRPGKPQVSLTGRSKNSSYSEVIRAAKEARQTRERERKLVDSAVKIQAFFRGFRDRFAARASLEVAFEGSLRRLNDPEVSEEKKLVTLRQLLRGAAFFLSASRDGPRLLQILSYCVTDKTRVARCVGNSSTSYSIKRVLVLACNNLRHATFTGSRSIHALPLRALETFLDPSTFKDIVPDSEAFVAGVAVYCVRHGFYDDLLAFFNDRVPVDINAESPNERPLVTPLAQSLLTLLMTPLRLSRTVSVRGPGPSQDFDDVYEALTRSAFVDHISPQVGLLFIDALTDDGFSLEIYLALLKRLLPAQSSQVLITRTLVENNSTKSSARIPALRPSPWLLMATTMLGERLLGNEGNLDVSVNYLQVLEILVLNLPHPGVGTAGHDSEDEDDEDVMDYSDVALPGSFPINKAEAAHHSVALLRSTSHSELFQMAARSSATDDRIIGPLCAIAHFILRRERGGVLRLDLLSRLAYAPSFLRSLWAYVNSLNATLIGERKSSLLALVARGVDISNDNLHRVAPPLTLFAALFSHLLVSLHENEFLRSDFRENPSGNWNPMPFVVNELVDICATLRDVGVGIIKLAHPDSWTQLNEDYRHLLDKSRLSQIEEMKTAKAEFQATLVFIFKYLVTLIKQLHSRDSRNPFTPSDHWLADVDIDADKLQQIYRAHQIVFQMQTFTSSTFLDAQQMNQEEGVFLSNTDVKNLTILRELPFVVPFRERVKILQRIIAHDKSDHQEEMFLHNEGIVINVRRGFLYEDAFEKLSPENEPNLKKRMRVQLQNAVGLDEAGIDGGGIFREFLNELLKEAFNPTRGYFVATHDKLLYPNPLAHLIDSSFKRHYYFLGRMLGKAIYENMLVELPFAAFFLSKIFGQRGGDVDFHHLASLDPEIYDGLLYMKNYRGDVKNDLNLDFSLLVDEFGETRRVDLKPNGREITVDDGNRIEFIHLVADFYLNKRIRTQCKAFYKGLADVVDLEWLRMFNYHEHQVIISGASHPVDLADLRIHTHYSGGYADDHPVIQNFWEVAEGFDERKRRALLKFVTSCSRPPLLGFKDLYPAFCIHSGGADESRLPSAATCMNLLKLPEYKDVDNLRSKITYAIESGAGFELS